MATYYFDANLGSNTTGDGSLANPWQYYEGKYTSIVAGDRLLFKRGTTQLITTIYIPLISGNSSTQTYYGVYGSGTGKVTWAGQNVWGSLLNGSKKSYVTLEDFDFDGSNQTSGTIYFAGQDTGSVSNIIIRRCRFFGVKDNGVGLLFTKESTSTTAEVKDCLIEDCDFFNNGAHGTIVIGCSNITYKRCRAWNNGKTATAGGHGFSARAVRNTVTSGWTLVSGTTYSRTLSATETDVYYLNSTSSYLRLTKNTSTPTTPSAGQFGVSTGTLYVNAGVDANTISITYAYVNCSNILFEDCEAFNNIWNPGSTYHEGHGIALDDFTQNSTIRKCFSHDNQGLGLSNNGGDGNLIESNIVTRNWESGVTTNYANNVVIRNNTFYNNNYYNPVFHTGEIRFSAFCNSCTVTNNYLEAGLSGNIYGIDINPVNSGFTISNNNIVGYTTPVKSVSAINTTSYSNQLSKYFTLISSSPLIAGGNYIQQIQDKNFSTFQNPPSIGAYEYIRPRTFRS